MDKEVDNEVEDAFETRHAPSGQVRGRLTNVDDLAHALASVDDERWRLDVLWAAEEIVYAIRDQSGVTD